MHDLMSYFNEVRTLFEVLSRIAIRSNLFWTNFLVGVPIRPSLHPIAEAHGFIVRESVAWLILDKETPLIQIQKKFRDLFEKAQLLMALLPPGDPLFKSSEKNPANPKPSSNIILFNESEVLAKTFDEFLLQINHLNQFCLNYISAGFRFCINFHIELIIPIDSQQEILYNGFFPEPTASPLLELFSEGLRLNLWGPEWLESAKGILLALFPDLFAALASMNN